MNQKGLKVFAGILRAFNVALIVVGAVAIVVTALVVINPSMFESVSVSVPIGFTIEGQAGSIQMGSGSYPVEIDHATGLFTIRGDSRGLVAIVATFMVAGLALAWLGLRWLRLVVASASKGEPFEQGNEARVRSLGWLAIGMGILRGLYRAATYLYADAQLDSDVITASLRLDLGLAWIGAGAVLLALGEVFRRGNTLQQDHDLTV
jgi:hypothetical protein